MTRVTLVHWHAGEAEARAGELRAAGYAVTCFPGEGTAAPHTLRQGPPDVFVIDLRRLPSQGGSLGVWLRQQPPTRRVPLLFVAGDPAKTERVRALLPDAAYTPWEEILAALPEALRAAPQKPVVPGTFDAYAGTPLPKKLGIGPGSTVALLSAPDGLKDTLGPLPEGARVSTEPGEPAQVTLLFVATGAELEQRFAEATSGLPDGGRLWIAWPKKASGMATDLSQAAVRAFGLAAGLVDFKIASLDATWSALCFTRRRGRPAADRAEDV